MFRRIGIACNKLFFCYKVSSGFWSFIRLMLNTKRFKWNGSKYPAADEKETAYIFRIMDSRYPFFLRTHSGDLMVFYEIFWTNIYDTALQAVSKPHVIIDLGANIGMASLYFGMHFPESLVFGVEADPNNFRLMKKNLAEGIEKKQVKILNAAIHSVDGTLGLERTYLKYNTKTTQNINASERVRAISMNTLFNELDIGWADLVKIDIEGGERNLFSGDTGWLDKVGHIIVEIHSEEDKAVCMAVLSSHRFFVKAIKEDVTQNLFYATKENKPLPTL